MHLVSELEAQLILSLRGEQDSQTSTESGDESPPPPRDGFRSRFGNEPRSDERDLVEPDSDWLPGDFDPWDDDSPEAA
jgi:hypothetical protein